MLVVKIVSGVEHLGGSASTQITKSRLQSKHSSLLHAKLQIHKDLLHRPMACSKEIGTVYKSMSAA